MQFRTLSGISEDPRTIQWQNERSDDESDISQADLVVLNKGRRMNDSLFH